MALTPIEERLKKIAISLGFLEGLAYGLMSLICIIIHYQSAKNFIIESYMDVVEAGWYTFFLYPDPMPPPFNDFPMRPEVFVGFVWVHFFLNVGWVAVSALAFLNKTVMQYKFLTAWSHLTLLISVWDLITVIVMGANYQKCLDISTDDVLAGEVCATGMVPVLVITAKGFVLWIINVVFALVLMKMAAGLKNGYQNARQAPGLTPVVYSPQHIQPNVDPYHQHLPAGYPSSPQQFPGYAQPSPVVPSTPQNHFQYPVAIPEPDYPNYPQGGPTGRRY